MDFRSYPMFEFDVTEILLWSLMVLFIVFASAMFYKAYQMDQIRDEYVHACVDAGGTPVSTLEYVKGEKNGYLCINPSATIEVN